MFERLADRFSGGGIPQPGRARRPRVSTLVPAGEKTTAIVASDGMGSPMGLPVAASHSRAV